MEEKRISVRLDEDTHKKFKILATKAGKAMSDILLEYIKKLINEDEKNGEKKN